MPPVLAHLVEVCWAEDPELRPTFEEIVQHLNNLEQELERKGSSGDSVEFDSSIELTDRERTAMKTTMLEQQQRAASGQGQLGYQPPPIV